MSNSKISALTSATTPLAGTEVLPIVQGSTTVKVSVANLTAGRPVAMGGGSFTDNITQSTAAKGVNFTANTPAAGMTSQLLNWYEEGTWTPTPNAGSFSGASGRYTRIGRLVNIHFDFTVATGGGSTMNAPIASSVTAASGIYTSGQLYAAGTTSPTIVIGGGGATMYFRTVGSAVGFSAMTFTAGAAITGTLSYTV